jgi:hypothetical protein
MRTSNRAGGGLRGVQIPRNTRFWEGTRPCASQGRGYDWNIIGWHITCRWAVPQPSKETCRPDEQRPPFDRSPTCGQKGDALSLTIPLSDSFVDRYAGSHRPMPLMQAVLTQRVAWGSSDAAAAMPRHFSHHASPLSVLVVHTHWLNNSCKHPRAGSINASTNSRNFCSPICIHLVIASVHCLDVLRPNRSTYCAHRYLVHCSASRCMRMHAQCCRS